MKFALLFLYTGLTLGNGRSRPENRVANKRLNSHTWIQDIEVQLASSTENVINTFLRRLQEFAPRIEVDPRIKDYFYSAPCKSLYGLEKLLELNEMNSRSASKSEILLGKTSKRDNSKEKIITQEDFINELHQIPLSKFAMSRLKTKVNHLFRSLSIPKRIETDYKLHELNRRWKKLIYSLKTRRNPTRAYRELRKHLRKYLREAVDLIVDDFSSMEEPQVSKTKTQYQLHKKKQQYEEKIVTEPTSSTVKSIELVDNIGTPSKIHVIPIDESSNTIDSDKRHSSEQIPNQNKTQTTDYVDPSFMSVMGAVKDLIKINLNLDVPKSELKVIFSYLQYKYKSQNNANTNSTYTNKFVRAFTDTDRNIIGNPSKIARKNSNININTNSKFNNENEPSIMNSSQLPLAQNQQQLIIKEQEQEEAVVTELASSTVSYVELVGSTLPSQTFTIVDDSSTYTDELALPQNLTGDSLNKNSSVSFPVEGKPSNNKDSEYILASSEIKETVTEQSNTDDSEIKSSLEQISTPNAADVTERASSTVSSVELVESTLPSQTFTMVDDTSTHPDELDLSQNFGALSEIQETVAEQSNTDHSEIKFSLEKISTSNETKNNDYIEPSFMKDINNVLKVNLNFNVPTNELTEIFTNLRYKYERQKNIATIASINNSTVMKTITDADTSKNIMVSSRINTISVTGSEESLTIENSGKSQISAQILTNNSENNPNRVENSRKIPTTPLEMFEDKENNLKVIVLPSSLVKRYKLTEVKPFETYNGNEEFLASRSLDSREPNMKMGNFAITGFNNYHISGMRVHKKSDTRYEITCGADIGPLMIVPANPIPTSRSEEPPIARFMMQIALNIEADLTMNGDDRRVQLRKVEVDHLRSKNIEMMPECFQNNYLWSLKFTDLVENSVNSMEFDRYFTNILREILREGNAR